jgi:hypothetical protein
VTPALTLLAALALSGGGPSPDVTAVLQEHLDAGGEIDVTRLPDGSCYRTRGLRVTVIGTTMIVDARGNDLRGNRAGRWRFVRLGRGSHLG